MDSLMANMDPALISAIMSDPEILSLMARPDIQQKMQTIAANPGRMAEFVNDPDIQRLVQKFQSLGLNPNSMMGSVPSPSPLPNPWAASTSSSSNSSPGAVVHIFSKAQFDTLIRSSPNKLVAVDYTASWCGPCKFISPHFDRLASKYSDHGVFLKVDVDKNRDIATDKGIRSMPTFQFYMDGAMVTEFSGADQDKLENTISLYVDRIKEKLNVVAVVPSPYKHIPLKPEEIVNFQQCKFDIIKQKIVEFNALPECSQHFDDVEMQLISSLIDIISDRKTFHRTSISSDQKQLVSKMLECWQPNYLPPLLNLLRMAIFHSSMDSWVTLENLSLILKSCDSNSDCQLTALRILCNLFVRLSCRPMLVDKFDAILDQIRPFYNSTIGAIRLAYLSVLINYAIVFCDPKMESNANAQSGKVQLLSICIDMLQSAQDEKVAQRLLIITGTLLFRDSTSKSIGQSLQLAELCTEIKNKFPSSTEIGEITAEVTTSLNDENN